MTGESALPPALRAGLDAGETRLVAEYLASRLDCEQGTWSLTLEFRDGVLRKVYRRHGPVGTEEMERIALREAAELSPSPATAEP